MDLYSIRPGERLFCTYKGFALIQIATKVGPIRRRGRPVPADVTVGVQGSHVYVSIGADTGELYLGRGDMDPSRTLRLIAGVLRKTALYRGDASRNPTRWTGSDSYEKYGVRCFIGGPHIERIRVHNNTETADLIEAIGDKQ